MGNRLYLIRDLTKLFSNHTVSFVGSTSPVARALATYIQVKMGKYSRRLESVMLWILRHYHLDVELEEQVKLALRDEKIIFHSGSLDYVLEH